MRRLLLATILCASALIEAEDFPYHQPSKEIQEVLNAPPTPQISVSPHRDYAILMQGVRYPPIAEVAQPMLRLAGIRVDTNTNGMHLAPYFVSFTIKRLADGGDVAMTAPIGARLGEPVWSPEGKQFAFTNITAHGIDLWIGSPVTGQTRRVAGATVNAVRVGNATPVQWMGDNRTLMVTLVPGGRSAVPAEAEIPKGPHVQESLGHAGPAPTFEDLLATPHDEDLFDYYATAQPAYVD
jgi:hypothetical protein